MIDAALLPIQRRALEPIAQALAARGIGADAITLASFAVGLAAVPALGRWHMGWTSVAPDPKQSAAENTAGRCNMGAAEASAVMTKP